MSANASPTHYNDLDEAFISDARFKVDISQKMKVPDKISFNPNANGNWHNGWAQDNINMHVPEKILVMGQDRHIGNSLTILVTEITIKIAVVPAIFIYHARTAQQAVLI